MHTDTRATADTTKPSASRLTFIKGVIASVFVALPVARSLASRVSVRPRALGPPHAREGRGRSQSRSTSTAICATGS